MITRNARRSESGVALLTAMIVVIIVGGMAAAFLTLSFSQSTQASLGSEREVALHVAEAGVEDTINKLTAYSQAYAQNNNQTPSSSADFMVISNSTPTITGNMNGGTFTATVANPSGTTPVYQGPYISGGYIITSKGVHQKMTRTLEVTVAAVDLTNPFRYGLFGDVSVDAGGSFFADGFDSTKGTYASQPKNTKTFSDGKTYSYVDATGNIGSNGAIGVTNNVTVMGNVTPGPGQTSPTAPHISGSTAPAIAPETMPAPDYSPPSTGTTSWPSWINGGITPIGDPLGLTPKNYVIDSFDMTGNPKGTLLVQGTVTIWCKGSFKMNSQMNLKIDVGAKLIIYQQSGDFTINGQAQVGTADASRFQVYSQTTGTVTFNGGSDVVAAVYAPSSQFKNNGGNAFYGSMVAKTMSLTGTADFHYDENLARLTTPKPVFKIMAWVERTNQ